MGMDDVWTTRSNVNRGEHEDHRLRSRLVTACCCQQESKCPIFVLVLKNGAADGEDDLRTAQSQFGG